MTFPIEVGYPVSGATLYAIIHTKIDDDRMVWNFIDQEWQAWDAVAWAEFAVPLTEEAGSGYYAANLPDGIGNGVLTTEIVYRQNGGSPAQGDTLIGVGQSQGTNICTINSSGDAAINMAQAAGAEARGEAQAGTLTVNAMTTNLGHEVANAYTGRTVIWIGGALDGVAARILSYTPGTGLLVYSTIPTAPTAGAKFIIV